MTAARQWRFWLIGLIVFLIAVYLLRAILLPFVAGMAVAYFLDPACDRLERWGCSRTLATALVTGCFAVFLVLALLLLVPLVVEQLTGFLSSLPDLLGGLHERLLPYYQELQQRFNLPDLAELADMARARMGTAMSWLAAALEGLLSQGMALASLLSLVFITPVVAFYLLRDWDHIVAKSDGLLPRDLAATIREQVIAIDQTMAGFARGQATVCLVLGAYYASALLLVGLPFGLFIGVAAGLLTFIPYVGACTGFVVSLAIALGSFEGWERTALVVGIFAVGQVLEGNVLTPKLVGEKVGLHPVWIIFALLAGGTLFGFVGLLLAVPSAAAIGVLVRFCLGQYRASTLYLGHRQVAPAGPAPVTPPANPPADADGR